MLDVLKSYCFFTFNTYKSILFLSILSICLPLRGFEYLNQLQDVPRSCEHEWVSRYLNSLNHDTPIDEVVDFLVSLKISLLAKGYEVPQLAMLCLNLRDQLIEQGVKVNDEIIDQIYEEICKRENYLITRSSNFSLMDEKYEFKLINSKKHKQKNKEKFKNNLEVSDGFAIGFVKALGGALLCIIPHPVTIAIGSGLVLNGINDMVNHAGDPPSKETEIDEKTINRKSS